MSRRAIAAGSPSPTTRDGEVVAIWLDHRDLPLARRTQRRDVPRGASAQRVQDRIRPMGSRAPSCRSCSSADCRIPTARGHSLAASATAARPPSPPAVMAPSTRRGGTSTLATSATSRSRCLRMVAARSRLRSASATTSGSSTAVPRTVRRSPSMEHDAFTWCGRRSSRARPQRVSRRSACSTPRHGTESSSQPASGFRPTGVPRHPQITTRSRGEIVVAWDEQTRGVRRVAIARGTTQANGTMQFVRQTDGGEGVGVYPAVATTGDATILVWTAGPAGQTKLRAERLAF